MLPALIGAGAGLLGGIMQNSAARAAADKQMAFQKQTLQHSYQWGMEDMKKAGLNPMLAYKQGGAGSASGSSYTPQNVGAAAVQGGSTAANSAMALARQKTELDNIRADTKLKADQSDTAIALALQHRMNAAQAAAQTGKTNTETSLLGHNLASAKAAEAEAKTDLRINASELGQIMRYIERGKRVINPFAGAGASYRKNQ